MQCQTILLLLWTLTAFVSCQASKPDPQIRVTTVSDGIELSCKTNKMKSKDGQIKETQFPLKLDYEDENTGEYACMKTVTNDDGDNEDIEDTKIFVKFRKCENCIELDLASILGLAIGNVVATTVIGVAVYLTVSQNRTSPTISHKSSDRQPLVPNEGSSRAPNDHYQSLKHRSGQKDTYDVIANKK